MRGRCQIGESEEYGCQVVRQSYSRGLRRKFYVCLQFRRKVQWFVQAKSPSVERGKVSSEARVHLMVIFNEKLVAKSGAESKDADIAVLGGARRLLSVCLSDFGRRQT